MTSDDDDITVNASTTLRKDSDDDVFQDENVYLTVASHGLTDVGRKRIHNEDSFYCDDENCIWVVADGMGGHNAGDLASQSLVLDIESNYEKQDSLDVALQDLEKIIQQTNLKLIKIASEISRDTVIGSTVVVLTTIDNRGFLLWAGDSRVYRVRSGTIEQLTRDHSLINDMIEQDIIKAEEAEFHPDQNKITRAVGYDKNLRLDYRKLAIKPGDRYVICSDGLTKGLSDDEILSVANHGSTEPTNQELMKRALEAGGTDNITTITVDFFKG